MVGAPCCYMYAVDSFVAVVLSGHMIMKLNISNSRITPCILFSKQNIVPLLISSLRTMHLSNHSDVMIFVHSACCGSDIMNILSSSFPRFNYLLPLKLLYNWNSIVFMNELLLRNWWWFPRYWWFLFLWLRNIIHVQLKHVNYLMLWNIFSLYI